MWFVLHIFSRHNDSPLIICAQKPLYVQMLIPCSWYWRRLTGELLRELLNVSPYASIAQSFITPQRKEIHSFIRQPSESSQFLRIATFYAYALSNNTSILYSCYFACLISPPNQKAVRYRVYPRTSTWSRHFEMNGVLNVRLRSSYLHPSEHKPMR